MKLNLSIVLPFEHFVLFDDLCLLFLWFQLAESGVYKTLWENNINVNPENIYSGGMENYLKALQRARTEKFVRLSDVGFLKDTIMTEGFCDLAVAPERFFKSNYAMATQKGFPYLEKFNNR